MTLEKEFNELLDDRGFRFFIVSDEGIATFGVGLKEWSYDEIRERGWLFNFSQDVYSLDKCYQQMINTLTESKLETELIFKPKQP